MSRFFYAGKTDALRAQGCVLTTLTAFMQPQTRCFGIVVSETLKNFESDAEKNSEDNREKFSQPRSGKFFGSRIVATSRAKVLVQEAKKSEMFVNESHQFAFAHGAGVLIDELSVFVNEDGRNAANVVLGGNGAVFIDVVLANHGLALVLRGGRFQRRSQHTARTAPRSPEVNKDRLAGDGLDIGIKGGVGNVNDVFAHSDYSILVAYKNGRRLRSEVLSGISVPAPRNITKRRRDRHFEIATAC